jgi:hypothetical protein
MIQEFKKYDVVSLNESFDTFTHRQHELCVRMEEAGFKYVASSTKPGLCESKMIDGGVIVFSKFPIIDTKFFDYGTMGQSDGMSKKGILYCRIMIRNQDKVIPVMNLIVIE